MNTGNKWRVRTFIDRIYVAVDVDVGGVYDVPHCGMRHVVYHDVSESG